MVSGIDGKYMLNNGKHWVAALLQVCMSDEYQRLTSETSVGEQSAADPASWLSDALMDVFTGGLVVDCVRMPTDDRLAHAATQCLSHESEQNRHRVSTIGDKISIARKAHTEHGFEFL